MCVLLLLQTDMDVLRVIAAPSLIDRCCCTVTVVYVNTKCTSFLQLVIGVRDTYKKQTHLGLARRMSIFLERVYVTLSSTLLLHTTTPYIIHTYPLAGV